MNNTKSINRINSGFSVAAIFNDAQDKNRLYRSTFLSNTNDNQYLKDLQIYTDQILKNRKTKKDQLVKISACLIGYVYDQLCGNTDALDFACDLVNVLSVKLAKEV